MKNIGALKNLVEIVQKPFNQTTYIFVTAFTIVFLLVNFDEKFGSIFGIMALFGAFLASRFHGKLVPIESDSARLSDIGWGLAGLIPYFLIASIVAVVFAAGSVSQVPRTAASVLDKFGSTIPAYQGSQTTTVVAFGFDVPLVESVFFTMLMLFVAKAFKIDPFSFSLGNLGLISVISYAFMEYHRTARQIAPGVFDTVALLITFLFMAVSLLMLVLRAKLTGIKEYAPLIWMHIFANTIALLVRFKNPVTMSVLASLGVT